jgi:hypothetical protein
MLLGKIKSGKVACFSSPKSMVQITMFSPQPTTSSPRFYHQETRWKSQTPNKNAHPATAEFFPQEP